MKSKDQRYYHVTFYFPYDKYYSKCKYSYEIAEKDSLIHYVVLREILFPIIKKYSKQFKIWRLHRMFIDTEDATKTRPAVNHFKFKFMSDRQCFDDVVKEIRGSNVYKLLHSLKVISSMEMLKSVDSNSLIASDNDSMVPYAVKESWPYFACGMSKSWLRMVMVGVREVSKEKIIPISMTYLTKDNVANVLMFYKDVRYYVGKYWIQNAKFFFHHMNVLFGNYKIEARFRYGDFTMTGIDSIIERGNDIYGEVRF